MQFDSLTSCCPLRHDMTPTISPGLWRGLVYGENSRKSAGSIASRSMAKKKSINRRLGSRVCSSGNGVSSSGFGWSALLMQLLPFGRIIGRILGFLKFHRKLILEGAYTRTKLIGKQQ